MSVVVKEVLTKKDLKKWVLFPNKLYKNNKYYVPFLSPHLIIPSLSELYIVN